MTSQKIIRLFAAHLAEDGKRPETIDSYVGDASASLATWWKGRRLWRRHRYYTFLKSGWSKLDEDSYFGIG